MRFSQPDIMSSSRPSRSPLVRSSSPLRPPRSISRNALPWLAAVGLLVISTAQGAEWLLSGDLGAHDPSVVKEDGAYENGSWWWSPATGTGLAMKYSPDGVRWFQGLQIFTENSIPRWWVEHAPKMKRLNVWAPDIRKFGDRYWCYYSVSEFGTRNSAIGLLSASGIFRGDWREEGLVLASREGRDGYSAMDPSLTIDAEGNPWLSFGSYFEGIHVVQLDPKTMKPAKGAPVVQLLSRQSDIGLEASNIVYVNGYYYLFAAIDLCCNGKDSTSKIAYARSRKITGPYEGKREDPANAVSAMIKGSLSILEQGDHRWAGMGSPFVSPHGDGWIMTRHGYDKLAGGAQKMRISDLYWDNDGWPTFEAPALADPIAESGMPVQIAAPSSITYQWQISMNGGKNWDNLFETPTYSGTSAAILTIQVDESMDGYQYRVITGNGAATSEPCTLTVRPAPKSP